MSEDGFTFEVFETDTDLQQEAGLVAQFVKLTIPDTGEWAALVVEAYSVDTDEEGWLYAPVGLVLNCDDVIEQLGKLIPSLPLISWKLCPRGDHGVICSLLPVEVG